MKKAVCILVLVAFHAQHGARTAWTCCGNSFGPSVAPPSNPPSCSKPEVCNPCQDKTRSPNFLMSGNYRAEYTDLALGGEGPSVAVYRAYNSHDTYTGPVGKGWHHSLILQAARMRDDIGEYVLVRLPSASRVMFTKTGGTYAAPAGHDETLVENQDGSLTLTWSDGSAWHYTSDGWIDTITDRYGQALTYVYTPINGQKRPIEVHGAGNQRLTIGWNGAGRIRSITDHAGRTVEYTYDEDNNLLNVEDPVGRIWTYQYQISGDYSLLTAVEFQGLTYQTAAYDSSNRVIGYSDGGETWTIEYQADRTIKRDASSNEWQYFFDSEGRATKAIDPLANTTEWVRDADGKLQTQIDPAGVKTYYTYNPNGTTASVTKDYQGTLAVRYEYAYDASFPERVTTITPVDPATGQRDPDWQGTQYEYWQAGDPAPGALKRTYTVRSDGTPDLVATYEYDSLGRMTKITDASGAETTYGYDAQTGELTTVTMPPNSDSGGMRTQTYTRDDLGRLTSTTDPAGRTTTYTYEALGRIATVTLPDPTVGSPLDFTTRYSYDNLESGILYTNQTDPNSNQTRQGFDQHGRLLRSVDPLGNVTQFAYADGHLVSVTDANDNVTTYTYDASRRLSATLFPDGAIETYTYWPDGQLKRKTDRKGQTITYNYDAFKRMIEKAYPNATSIRYIYDGQKLVRVEDGYVGETHTFQHDTAYRVVQETQGPRGTLTYTYQTDGRLDGYAVAGGASATYDYYTDGSLKNIQWSPVAGYFTYAYTFSGQYDRITFPTGQYRQFSYDDQGRLLQLANIHPTAGNLATFAYGYDINHYTGAYTMLGQRTSMTMDFPAANQTASLHKYYYDSNYQLTRTDYPPGNPFNAEVHEWTYDAIGNRLTNTVDGVTQTYTYFKNGGNPKNGERIQSDSVHTYTFDSNGNMISKVGAVGTWTFGWDYDNRLDQFANGDATHYSFDYTGRRTASTGAANSLYLHDGFHVVYSQTTNSVEYLSGRAIDEPLARLGVDALGYGVGDALGSVLGWSDAAAQITDPIIYDAWGVVQRTVAPLPQLFGYTGRHLDGDLRWDYRAREYLADLGRFAQEDPTVSSTSLSNRYTYVGSSPLTWVDPLGLFSYDDSCYRHVNGHIVIRDIIAGENALRVVIDGTECANLLRAHKGWEKKDMHELMQHCADNGSISCDCGESSDCALTPPWTSYHHPKIVLLRGSFAGGCPNTLGFGLAPTFLHECLHTFMFGKTMGRPIEPREHGNEQEKLFWKIISVCTGYKEP